ncbi:MAG: DUF2771 family protein [Pseudonocardiaceae bacterium]
MDYRNLPALAAVAGAVLLTSACSEVGPPVLTVYADGETITVEPSQYCDVQVTSCEPGGGAQGSLQVRPGLPVQISVPGEVADDPWLVNVQSVAADGALLPVEQEVFTPGRAHAYTAQPAGPDARILVIEVQQIGVAFAADGEGNPILDEAGNPQLVARGLWTLELQAG